jgi:hypothetical protein
VFPPTGADSAINLALRRGREIHRSVAPARRRASRPPEGGRWLGTTWPACGRRHLEPHQDLLQDLSGRVLLPSLAMPSLVCAAAIDPNAVTREAWSDGINCAMRTVWTLPAAACAWAIFTSWVVRTNVPSRSFSEGSIARREPAPHPRCRRALVPGGMSPSVGWQLAPEPCWPGRH